MVPAAGMPSHREERDGGNANALAEVPALRTFRTMRTHALLLLTAAVGGCRPGRSEAYARFTGGEPSAAGRVESATAVVGDDLYLFGGFEAGYKATRDIEAFNIRTNRWSDVGQMPSGITHANAVVVDDEVVSLGTRARRRDRVDARGAVARAARADGRRGAGRVHLCHRRAVRA